MKALVFILLSLFLGGCLDQEAPPAKTQENLEITPIVHSSVMFNYKGIVVYVDPTTYLGTADFSDKFNADIILITHDHFDHYDGKTINQLLKKDTQIIAPESLHKSITYARVLRGGQSITIGGIRVKALPAYNLVRGESEEKKYHPYGAGNGYVLTFGGARVYVAGDTECTPEMKALKNIDIAFLPIDGVYTMSPEEAASCAKAIKPKVVYPYHQGNSDPNRFASLLKDEGIEVRVHRLP
jgi:L-ascorbate metabolism protein UlaG (beta-lactamase superfamily)